jgi:hypothetical protein
MLGWDSQLEQGLLPSAAVRSTYEPVSARIALVVSALLRVSNASISGLHAYKATDLEELAGAELVEVATDLNLLGEASFPLKRQLDLLPHRHNATHSLAATPPQPQLCASVPKP